MRIQKNRSSNCWYDPTSGRWLSKDPIGISGGLNQYVAFGNNPVMLRDPDGLRVRSFTIIGAKAAVVFGLSGDISFVWDDQGNRGLALTGGVGTGVYLGGNSFWNGIIKRVSDVASRYSEGQDCDGTINDLNGGGLSASAAVLVGGNFDLDIQGDGPRVSGLDVGIGGAVFKTGTVVIPLWRPTWRKPFDPRQIRSLPAHGWRP